jgi:hypothetical protein
MAILMPPVFTSIDDVQKRWDESLAEMKRLLARPHLKLPHDSHVCNWSRHDTKLTPCSLTWAPCRFIWHTLGSTTKSTCKSFILSVSFQALESLDSSDTGHGESRSSLGVRGAASRAMAAWQDTGPFPVTAVSGRQNTRLLSFQIKTGCIDDTQVGIISRHLRHHSIGLNICIQREPVLTCGFTGKFMRGIFKWLPRDRIELYAIFPGQVFRSKFMDD